jgi:phage gp36-like protein
MGRYTSFELVAGRYPSVANYKSGAPAAESHLITGAEAEVDARLARKYTVPFTGTIPSLVVDLATDLAYLRMSRMSKESKPVYDHVQKLFELLADGTMILTDYSGAALNHGDSAWCSTSYHSAFGPDSPANWQVSYDQVHDAMSTRGQV